MLTSIILSVFVLAGITFLMNCFRGFHRELAAQRSGQIPVSAAFVEQVRAVKRGRIIVLPKSKTQSHLGKAASNPPQKSVAIKVTGAERKCL